MRKIRLITALFLCLLITGLANAQSPVERIEPRNWWVGMENSSLQLMIHGDHITDFNPRIDYPGVKIDRVVKVPNPNYLFVYLTIGSSTEPGQFNIRFMDDGEQAATYPYALNAREDGSAQRKGFNNSDIIYLITPDRFANGNPSNDSVEGYADKLDRSNPGGRHGGDIQGIINHLDYIADMGFTALWINPLLENVQPKYSYHGYSTTDFYKIDPRFGSNEQYRELVDKANQRGIKVIMDLVLNHIGTGHWWMDDLPSDDWVNNSDHYVQTNHRRTSLWDTHASKKDRQRFVEGWFVPSMPDLNQENPLVATYLIQTSIWWIESAHLSGFRVDTYPYSNRQFLSTWSRRIMQEYPNFNIVGEEWSLNPSIISQWQHGKDNGYKSGLPSLFDFPLQHALATGLKEKENWDTGLIQIYESLANDFVYPNPSNLVIFPDNHDMDRFYSQLGKDMDLFKMGLAFVLTTRGIPEIYYGTEIAMFNPEGTGHGVIRSDFPGGWKSDSVNAFTGTNLSSRQREAQTYLKKLANWRQETDVIQNGKLLHFGPDDGTYTYFRYNQDDLVMVVLNKNENPKQLNTSRFDEIMKGKIRGTNVLTGQSQDVTQTVTVPARSALILRLE